MKTQTESKHTAGPKLGEAVQVIGGRWHGCILTYMGITTLGEHLCEHSKYCGGVRVPQVAIFKAKGQP